MTTRIPLKLFILRTVLVLCGLAAVGTIVVLGFVSVFGGPHLSRQVIATTLSPDGHLESVLTRINGAADNSGYLVDVNSTAGDGDTARVANVHAAPGSDASSGLGMVWKDDHTLELRTPHGVFAKLEPGDVTVGGEPVVVVLKPQP